MGPARSEDLLWRIVGLSGLDEVLKNNLIVWKVSNSSLNSTIDYWNLGAPILIVVLVLILDRYRQGAVFLPLTGSFELLEGAMAGIVGVGLTLNEKAQLLAALTWRKTPGRDVNFCSNYSPSPLYDSREGEKWGIQENRKYKQKLTTENKNKNQDVISDQRAI